MRTRKGGRGKVVAQHCEKGARVCMVEDEVTIVMGEGALVEM